MMPKTSKKRSHKQGTGNERARTTHDKRNARIGVTDFSIALQAIAANNCSTGQL